MFAAHLYGQNTSKFAGDISSIENITTALLQTISGDSTAKRDWVRLRNLFWPTAQLNAIFHKGDSAWIKINTIDEFV